MTGSSLALLVSVRNLAEAHEAWAGGVDILDVKDPSKGSLGPADFSVLDEILTQAPPGGQVTAALGELAEAEQSTALFEQLKALRRLPRFMKVGFAGEADSHDWQERFIALAADLPDGCRLIPAAYADAHRANAPSVDAVCSLAIRVKTPYFLIDTWCKDGHGLLDWLNIPQLERLRQECDSHGIGLVLAGSLRLADIAAVAAVVPAVIAVRGAACAGDDRQAAVCGEKIRQLKNAIIHASNCDCSRSQHPSPP